MTLSMPLHATQDGLRTAQLNALRHSACATHAPVQAPCVVIVNGSRNKSLPSRTLLLQHRGRRLARRRLDEPAQPLRHGQSQRRAAPHGDSVACARRRPHRTVNVGWSDDDTQGCERLMQSTAATLSSVRQRLPRDIRDLRRRWRVGKQDVGSAEPALIPVASSARSVAGVGCGSAFVTLGSPTVLPTLHPRVSRQHCDLPSYCLDAAQRLLCSLAELTHTPLTLVVGCEQIRNAPRRRCQVRVSAVCGTALTPPDRGRRRLITLLL